MLQRIASLLRIQPPVIVNRGKLWGSGADYPTIGDDGWQTGAIWCNTSGAAGSSFYVNEGSVTSCNFVAVDTAAGASAGAIGFDDDVTGPLIYIETDTPTNDSYTTPFIITGAYSSSADHALVVSATNTRPVSFLFDDGGDVFAGGDIRAGLFRLLLTVDQTNAVTINALRAQIKANNEVDITSPSAVTSPLTGYLELDGAGARHLDGHVACIRAALETGVGAHTVDINLCGFESTLTSSGTFVGAGYGAAYAANISGGTALWQYGLMIEAGAVLTAGIFIGAGPVTALNVGRVTGRVIDYTTATSIGEAAGGHLIRYGTSAVPIIWAPTTGDSDHSGLQMYVTAAPSSGLGMALVRVKVTLTGTTRATANAGQFWTKIACTNYTGHYLGGHPTGVSGIIECAGALREAASPYAVMAGVCGEVRPISTAGNVDVGGVICGLHAKIFGESSDVDTGDVVGVFVQAISGSAADIGILVQPHTGGAAWTIGLEFDSSYGPIATGISIGACATEAITTATQAVSIMTASLTNAGGGSELNALNFAWTTTSTYGADADYLRGSNTFAVEAFLAIGSAGTPVVVNAAGSHVGILTNVNITAALTADGDVVGGGYHVVTLSAIPTTDMGVLSPVTAYMQNTIVCDGSTEFFGVRAAIYTATGGESVAQNALEVAIIDKTTTRATVGDIKGIMLSMEIADDEGATQIIGICLEETGTVPVKKGIHYRAGTFTVGIDFDDYCTTAIDIGTCTTGITLTGTTTTGIAIASGVTAAISITTNSTGSAAIRPIIDINWVTATDTGTAADPVYGDRTANYGIEACISVGDSTTPATVTATGSHVGFLTNLTLSGTLAQYDLFGGVVAICTVATAQTSVTDGIVSAVTGYIRHDGASGAQVVKTIFEAVRGVVYTASGDESVRQAAIVANIKDFGAHANAEEIAGLAMEFHIAARHGSGRASAIFIQSVNCAVDMDAVIELDAGNESKFTNFIKGTTTGSTCFVVNTSSSLEGETLQHVIVVEIDGDTGYIPVMAGVPT